MAYGTVLTDVVQSSVTGSPPQFNDGTGTQTGTLCRAWASFNSSGTIAKSFNVSSVTKNSTGDYTITFTNALPDANYAAGTCMNPNSAPSSGGGWGLNFVSPATKLTTSCRMQSGVSNSLYDTVGQNTVVFFD